VAGGEGVEGMIVVLIGTFAGLTLAAAYSIENGEQGSALLFSLLALLILVEILADRIADHMKEKP